MTARFGFLFASAILVLGTLASCQYPQAPPPVTQEDREASAQRLREIEDENFRYRDRERRSAARAGYYPYYDYRGDPGYSGARPVW
jgi:hypothetical protein